MYEIKVLKSDEFDRLPYKGIDDSLGIADVKRNRVFVRDTGLHEINRYLINHEIDHLVEEHATDEDSHGIRHKKGPKLFKDIFLPMISGGLFQPEANQRAAAQTQYVEGLGNVPANSGSYSPQGMGTLGSLMSASGGFNTPMSLFQSSGSYNPASSRLSDSVSGSSQPSIGIGPNSNNPELPPDLLERLKGSYSGRMVF